MPDLYALLESEERRAELASYGIDPVRVEQWLSERDWHVNDPTADEAIYNADRDLARRRRAAR